MLAEPGGKCIDMPLTGAAARAEEYCNASRQSLTCREVSECRSSSSRAGISMPLVASVLVPQLADVAPHAGGFHRGRPRSDEHDERRVHSRCLAR